MAAEQGTIYAHQSMLILDEKPKPILQHTEFEKKFHILEFTGMDFKPKSKNNFILEDFLLISGRTYKILTDLPVAAYRIVKIFQCDQSFLHERIQTVITHKDHYLIT